MKNNSIQLITKLMVIIILSSFVLWIGCDNTQLSPVEPFAQQEGKMLSKSNPAVQRIIDIQNRHTPDLMNIPGVVGTGTGLNAAGQLVVKVFIINPGIENIPEHVDGVPVVKEVTGMFVIYSDPTAHFPRPVPIGVSTGHPDITAGTIGCRVKDELDNVYALSNNHVYANSNDATIGDNELQPGPYDGGQDPADAIGTLHDFEPILFDGSNNYMDAAIASTTTSMVSFATPSDGYGTPSTTTASASIGLNVQKFGRTTHWTHGEVKEINVTVNVCYETRGPFKCVKLARFVDQFTIIPGDFSAGGDSGSLIVTEFGNNPVGLLFAGSDTRTIANPIDAVLSRFKVTIDDGIGGGNIAPAADFSFTTSGLTVDFTDQSTDSDGNVVGWNWDFGDSNISTSQNTSHTYAASGTYTVSLTATDDDGATGSTSQDVTVSDGNIDITLTAIGYKVRGLQKADLTWSGATGTQVEIHRDGNLIDTIDNNDFYTDNINQRGGGSYTYQVCEVGGSLCSDTVTVNF